jgi:predicted DNA-binding transcriptional regulator AlpA
MTDDAVLTLTEAAEFLRMSASWVHHSDVPRLKLGRKVRFLKSQLIAYAEARLTHRIKGAA